MHEDGHSINYIRKKYCINDLQLYKLWLLYQKEGEKILYHQPNIQADSKFKYQVALDIENKGISLV